MNTTANLTTQLDGIPETMLWTLHNRASEAERDDGILKDEQTVAIYRSLDYDFERSFGRADGSHAERSRVFDNELRAFLKKHPDGVIVNLGEGLETQRFRVDGDCALWLSIDVPEAIAAREHFIQPDEHHRHIATSALDRTWFEHVPTDRAVYITAQGLLMYFEPKQVADLFRDLAERFPGAWFAFDHIPSWLSRKTLRGWWKTPHYRTPPMPWGIDRHLIAPTLHTWVPNLVEVRSLKFKMPRGFPRLLMQTLDHLPWINRYLYGATTIHFGDVQL